MLYTNCSCFVLVLFLLFYFWSEASSVDTEEHHILRGKRRLSQFTDRLTEPSIPHPTVHPGQHKHHHKSDKDHKKEHRDHPVVPPSSVATAAEERHKATSAILAADQQLDSLQVSSSVSPPREEKKLHIIFVYTVVPAVCKYGLPEYIQITLKHTVFTQPDCVVVMASNYIECEKTKEQVRDIPGVLLVDTVEIMSNRTRTFANLSANIFASDYANELWMTSALRFLNLEDIFTTLSLSEALHVEADNLVYGRMSSLLPIFRSNYPLAATPLNTGKSFITASVLWIASFRILKHFTDFFLDITTNENNRWIEYLRWVRPYACCKPGGIDPDANGMGLKPYAINEMSMLSYYHELYPERLMLLPVVPYFTGYKPRRNFAGNLNDFRPGELETGYVTPGRGIWDPNSWGQHLGGTSKKRGRDRGFVDGSHIAGQTIVAVGCKPAMLCAAYATNGTYSGIGVSEEGEKKRGVGKWMNEMNVTMPDSSLYRYHCVTAPYVKCGDEGEWTPVWNLHVHSKNTMEFQSSVCSCSSAAVVEYFPQL